MPDELEKSREIFKEEARELLNELETSLLRMEEAPDDPELTGRVFRAMHTLKGSGSMFGFDDVASFTHDIESYFDMVRSGRLSVTKELIDLTLESLDQITGMLDASFAGNKPDTENAARTSARYRGLVEGADGAVTGKTGPSSKHDGNKIMHERPAPSGIRATYHITFRPSRDVLLNGTRPLGLINELRAMGGCIVTAHTAGIPALDKIDPERCYVWWDIVLTTSRCIDEVKDVFIFVEGDSEVSVKAVDGNCAEDPWQEKLLIGEILVEKGETTPEAVEQALRERKKIGEVLLGMGAVTPAGLDAALTEQKAIERMSSDQGASSIRVDSVKLDVLAELVGQLVTAQARLRRMSNVIAEPELVNISEEMDKLTEMLRDNTLSMRMVPFGTTFTKFKRLVRDLSRELGKDVSFVTGGGNTELDKTVIERLNDPVMHLIRNCLDHGIESPEERMAAGKPAQGRVSLTGAQSGGKIIITISDDGRGIDTELVRRVAVEKGLLTADDRPGEAELFALTMSAGFSTANTVNKVSGRGVGMDVVKKCMESLRGHVDIASTAGRGTVITLKLPLTLAIIDGLLVEVSDAAFVVPLGSVSECVEQRYSARTGSSAGRFVEIRGEVVPCIPLREQFGLGGATPEIEHLVIVEEDGRKAAVVVDRVVGEHQTVIKPLSKACRNAEGFSGATILGDGGLALILDMAGIVRSAQKGGMAGPKAA